MKNKYNIGKGKNNLTRDVVQGFDSLNSNRILKDISKLSIEQLLEKYSTNEKGLKEEQILKNRREYGDNVVEHGEKKSLIKRLAEAFINPFTLILLFLAIVSVITDVVIPIKTNTLEDLNYATIIIILTMVIFSGVLQFIQETRSGNAAEKLLEMITTTCTVFRSEKNSPFEIPLEDLVVGDIIQLSTGDMVPADIRILEAKDLFISQSSLTGESEPIEKTAALTEDNYSTITDYPIFAFMGSNVISGTAKAIVVSTGNNTLFGSIAKTITKEEPETSFTKGVNDVSRLLIKFMAIMVPIVFFINGFTKGNWIQAFLFAISIAVGLTPEMLPMIVTTCLAKGAVSMSQKKTVVKNLNSIQSFGAMDVLCTDKTGTITEDDVVLEYYLDIEGKSSSRILRHAYLNSYFQTGYKNLMDRAIIKRTEEQESKDRSLIDLSEAYVKVDEIPFDFSRRRLSVVVEDKNKKTQMITKGAVEEMLSICSYADYNGVVKPITREIKENILKVVDNLNDKGMRVIALAQKTNPSPVGAFGVKDEDDMVLLGYLAFLDPPKESAKEAIKALREYGVTTKVITGDNEKVARYVCKEVGIPTEKIVLGRDLESLDKVELTELIESASVFAKISPDQKAEIVSILKDNGHVVGFLGDGINDASALKTSDIGISVDSAVDIAKESADIILLEKSLMVLEEGIIEGRKTYANMIKYIKMTISSNFGNMFSVLAASALLPFLPMTSIQLIFLNLIYDLSCIAIPWDNVDEEFVKTPRNWDTESIESFMVWIGPTSSIFDWITYLVMYFIICPAFISKGVLYSGISDSAIIQSGIFQGLNMKSAYEAMFQAGWFIESMWSQTLVIHMIRTQKIPFIQSNASAFVTILGALGIIALTVIPFTPVGAMLDLLPLPKVYFLYLAVIIFSYMVLVTVMKKIYIKKYGTLL
ncbi:magnesium-translocating P-type ATPase [Anaerosphaera multitolerans]|uniref:Magnesium-transporting ATPase, P-type 1 n=1 Tax=Anaerosphaera multitolerans TaxID=2487351 RepID=A0A437S8W6_9FIRM|nr:magnesium-translocating P-type ATPase [Anaerosphaera multitolerans]RVU55546.1 magnesium-translocating P-type ATPase [Anaerosphaera multitolerans]